MNCLIFGYGYMGRIRHRVLAEHPEVQKIRIVDPGIDPVKENIQDLVLPPDNPIPWGEFDAVFVCTPNNVTTALCVEALHRCGRVFCEKPPARNWEEFQKIVAAAKEHPDSTLVFGFNHRFHPSIKAAKALIGEGGLGDILYMKGTYGKSGGKNYRENWRNDRAISGGGILLDQGIHMLDIFRLFVNPLHVADAVLADTFWKCDTEDNAFVLLKSEGGIPVFLHSSATLWKHAFHLEIGCREGYLTASGLLSKTGSYGREQLVVGRRQFEDEAFALGNPREEIIYFDRDESWKQEVEEFICAIREGRGATHGTLEEATEVMAILRDAYKRK